METEAQLPLPEAGQALLDVPMSPELMNYYRERLAASEHEIVGLRERVETCETSQAAQHKQPSRGEQVDGAKAKTTGGRRIAAPRRNKT